MAGEPAISAFGDAAILVELEPLATAGEPAAGEAGAGRPTDPGAALLASTAAAQAMASRIRSATEELAGFGAAVPAASSVLIHVDPTGASGGIDRAIDALRRIVEGFDVGTAGWPPGGSTLDVPVRYGGADGPDLDAVAELTGLGRSAVVELHASIEYRVLFLGFAPGFGYLGPLPAGLVLPRRASPRVGVPAGTVAIAGQHTAIYPVESPGGWQILGRTSLAMWDARRSPPALLEPGMVVRFVPERSS
jgi:KipI family sensor histidine kinase inhibitor